MMKKNKPINMATGGLMNMPPFIKKSEEEKEQGITPYDVNTPKAARQGLPARLLSPSRTRFKTGGFPDRDGSGDITQKDILIEKGIIDADGNMISKNKKAYGGLMKRQKYAVGDEVDPIDPEDIPELEETDVDDLIAKSSRDKLLNEKISQLESRIENITDTAERSKIENEIKQLKTMKSSNVRTAATGGLMKMSIGGAAGTSERYDRRKDYQAYAEGDVVEDESLMSPTGMNETDMGKAEADMEMMAEEDAEFGDMDAVVDTSNLSPEEEKVVDDAVEMFPELEGIIPKIVATEFREDGEVEGPGTGISDSIPALLSDGEFVFTAKAVKHIGVDKLRKMMKDAEAAYDSGMQSQEADAAMAE